MDKKQMAIVGIGETTYSSHSGMSSHELILQACQRAVTDAGLRMHDIDGVIIPREYTELRPYEFQFYSGVDLKYSAFSCMETTCGVINAIQMAQMALDRGQGNYFLIYIGANQATDSKISAPRLFHLQDRFKRSLEVPMGYFPQPVYYAMVKQRYSQLYGDIEPTLCAIAVNQRRNALLNGNAQMKKPLDAAGYYDSPMLADPLRLVDCCLVTDSAAAIVVTNMEHAQSLRQQPTPVLGMAVAGVDVASPYMFSQNHDILTTAAHKSTPAALAQAGISRSDVDVLEIYDCFTITALIQLEDAGFCAKGEAADFIGDGSRISLEGELPINTHGGQLSHGYSFGLCHVVEAVKQMRGAAGATQVKDAQLSMVLGYGAWNQGTMILGKA